MQPAGDVVLALLADEEAAGDLGAAHLVRERPDLFTESATRLASSAASASSVSTR
jgi:hypothetical protein